METNRKLEKVIINEGSFDSRAIDFANVNLPNLHTLGLHNLTINPPQLQNLLKQSTKLSEIKLNNCTIPQGEDITFPKFSNLKKIEMSETLMPHQTLTHLIKASTNLESLKLDKYHPTQVENLPLSKVTNLELTNCTHLGMITLLKGAKNLKHLKTDTHLMGTTTPKEFGQLKMTNLETLEFSENKKMKLFEPLFSQKVCPKLKTMIGPWPLGRKSQQYLKRQLPTH